MSKPDEIPDRSPTSDLDATIGDNLRAARRRANLTSETLAAEAGLQVEALKLGECGGLRFSTMQLMRLARALDVPMAELLSENPGRPV